MAKRNRRTPEELAQADEAKVRRLRAKLEGEYLKHQLSYYGAADRGRRSKDWKAPPSSADQALVPELPVIVARSRHAVANTWVGKAAMRAQRRNVVGRGIEVVPTAHDDNGQELTVLNAAAGKAWLRWTSDRNQCHIQRRLTFWQMQRTMCSEEYSAGTGFVIWSYQPENQGTGFQLQFAEVEQLDRTLNSFNGNEVRAGVEIDRFGAAIAYHFYQRNPNDYAFTWGLKSERIDAGRVFPYMNPERVSQTLGEPHLAAVLRDVRDLSSYDEATLYRARMESCIGFGIKKNAPTTQGPLTLPRVTGDTGTTATGMRTFDFTPGMVAELLPGEDLVPFLPTTPGNQYDPFTTRRLRNIGAGIGLSYGALTRHNDANYSAARQDMLEDGREIEPQQDALVDQFICPTYERWYFFAVVAGILPLTVEEFMADPMRYVEAEYIPPARLWIDPEKEWNAFEKAIKNRAITRREIDAMRGKRHSVVLRQIAAEREEAKRIGIVYPEDQEQQQAAAPQIAAPGKPAQKSLPVLPAEQADANTAAPSPLSAIGGAPNYRPLNDPVMRCGLCKYFKDGKCIAYDFAPTPSSVCDSWEAAPLGAGITGKLHGAPPLMPGDPGIDRGGFNAQDRT